MDVLRRWLPNAQSTVATHLAKIIHSTVGGNGVSASQMFITATKLVHEIWTLDFLVANSVQISFAVFLRSRLIQSLRRVGFAIPFDFWPANSNCGHK